MIDPLQRSDIAAASERIAGFVRQTPIIGLGPIISNDFDLTLKLELLQVTGSFKPRGAFSVLTSIDVPPAGVVAASGGNFGIAAAHAASVLGHRATIFVPETSPEEKIGRIAAHGADVRVIPGFYDDALARAMEFETESGAFQAHAYDQAAVMAGQGTLAMELDPIGADVIVVAVGGGGLIGGIASWVRDTTVVVAVEPEMSSSFHASVAAGRQVEVEVGGVAASSLGARSIGDHPWAARHWVDDAVLVTEDDIVDAQRWIWAETRLAVEPAAACTVAALLSGAYEADRGAHVVVVLSGGNVDPASVA